VWGGTELTWYVGHYLAYCTSPICCSGGVCTVSERSMSTWKGFGVPTLACIVSLWRIMHLQGFWETRWHFTNQWGPLCIRTPCWFFPNLFNRNAISFLFLMTCNTVTSGWLITKAVGAFDKNCETCFSRDLKRQCKELYCWAVHPFRWPLLH
jgi:hypothetical protein